MLSQRVWTIVEQSNSRGGDSLLENVTSQVVFFYCLSYLKLNSFIILE